MNKQWERLKVRFATWLSAISIVICVITVMLWPLSYMSGVQLSIRNGAGVRYALLTVPGQIGLAVVHGEPPASPSLDGCAKSFGAGVLPSSNTRDKLRWFWQRPAHSTVGFGTDQGSDTVYFGEVNASFKCDYMTHFAPTWAVSLLTLIIPVMWYRARQRRQFRIDNDLCMYCGSDMSSSPYRCPKCGKEQPW